MRSNCPFGQLRSTRLGARSGLVVITALVATLAACTEAPTDGLDAGPADGGGGAPDARPAIDAGRADAGPFDGNELRDAADPGGPGDESIRGTPLQGITITWSAPFELCNRWREGGSIADERDAKAHLTVWPAPRESLGSGHLAAATLPRVFVRRGPLADAQVNITAIRSALVDYRLTPQGAATSVAAELEHDLGRAGVLVESFLVYRTAGDARPVDLASGRFEHSFSLRSPGRAEAIALEPCGGPAELDDAVHVLVAERNGAHLALTRYARTAEANAGSAPMYIVGLDVAFGGSAPSRRSGQGLWFSTYAAEHHNWNDSSHFDFSADLAAWSLIYGPWRRTGQAPVSEALEAVDLRGVSGWDAPAELDLTWRDFGSGSARTETWAVPGRTWVRVDHAATGLRPTCTGGQVQTLGDYSDHVFQVFLCPRGQFPGVAIDSIVPVAFAEDASVVGQEVSRPVESTLSGRAAFTFGVGAYRVVFSKGAAPEWFLEVRDAGGAPISEAIASEVALWPRAGEEELAFTARAGDVSLKIVRRWVAPGVGESAIYAPVRMEATVAGRSWQVEAWDRLDYQNSHHNWMDALVATADDATLTWKTMFLPDHTDTLSVTGTDGTELLPETTLEAK